MFIIIVVYASADNKEAGVFNAFHRPMLSSGYGDGWGAWRVLVHEVVNVMCSCVPNVYGNYVYTCMDQDVAIQTHINVYIYTYIIHNYTYIQMFQIM